MKIKELHLRNIASIEKADIDFEHDLDDEITGTPASIFLIAGDTGAGKSAILDGIAMALYKNTPRLEGVTNKKLNAFTNTEGESIDVFSIMQYTRLGISENDPCYSEVVFEGNDGKEYRVKLELGITMSKTKEIKHRDPKWTYKQGDEEWQKVESKTGQPIADIIGLTFDQFSRMAMLAQGQFAAFLTGGKLERERILEQLTNTARFNTYGKAINNICSHAKTNKELADTECKTLKEHTLAPETVKQKQQEFDNLQNTNNELNHEHTQVNAVLDTIRKKQEAERQKRTSEEALAKAQQTFLMLAADLAYRYECIVRNKEGLAPKVAWLDARKQLDELYVNAKAVDIQLGQYKGLMVKIAELEKTLADEKGKTEELTRLLTEINAKVNDAKAAAKAKLAEVEDKSKEREQLNPTMINKRMAELNRQRTELKQLDTLSHTLEEKRSLAEQLKQEIDAQTESLDAQAKELAQVQQVYEVKKANEEASRSLLTTMQMSVDETLTELRNRLQNDHADICPLCGQPLDMQHLAKDFNQVLTPLQQSEKVAQEELLKATRARDEVKSRHDTALGALNNKREAHAKGISGIEREGKAIAEVAAQLNLDADQPLAQQIAAQLKRIDAEVDTLSQKQALAESLQTIIKRLTDEKYVLDSALLTVEKERLGMQHALEQNSQKKRELTRNIDEARLSVEQLSTQLDAALSAVFPAWATDIEGTARQFMADADDYCSHKKEADEARRIIELEENRISGITSLRDGIVARHATWNEAVVAEEHPSRDILSEWTSLNSLIDHHMHEVSQAEQIIGHEGIPDKGPVEMRLEELRKSIDANIAEMGSITSILKQNEADEARYQEAKKRFDEADVIFQKWDKLNSIFGGDRFRTLVQTYILRPLLNNANIYLEKITDRYLLTCSEENAQLSILVHDRYNKNQVRSVTVLSGGERFMISLALSLALSSLNRQDMNVNILFIDEGFGTLDENNLNSVMSTLEKLQDIAGQTNRRVGIISHREEIAERIPVKILVKKKGEGRSEVKIDRSSPA